MNQRVEINLDCLENVSFEEENKEGDSIASKKSLKHKMRLTWPIWQAFEHVLPSLDSKQKAKYKRCGVVYFADSKYGISNLKRHLDTCLKRNHRDLGQLSISQEGATMTLSGCKFDPKKF